MRLIKNSHWSRYFVRLQFGEIFIILSLHFTVIIAPGIVPLASLTCIQVFFSSGPTTIKCAHWKLKAYKISGRAEIWRQHKVINYVFDAPTIPSCCWLSVFFIWKIIQSKWSITKGEFLASLQLYPVGISIEHRHLLYQSSRTSRKQCNFLLMLLQRTRCGGKSGGHFSCFSFFLFLLQTTNFA